VKGGEVGDEGEESLKDIELFVDTLRNAVVHCLDAGWDRRQREREALDYARHSPISLI
jgi:hypothetical protein